MWYFAWILGVLLACAFGIINVMWMETEEMLGAEKDKYVSMNNPAASNGVSNRKF
jgi:cyd operon protein YbgT